MKSKVVIEEKLDLCNASRTSFL